MLERAIDFTGAFNQVKEKPPHLLPMEAREVSYDVEGKRLVDRINLKLTHGGVTMIMGPNGAGKSVLLRLLHGLLSPSSGTIFWGGTKLPEETRKRQAMMFQKPVLLRRSVAANIDFVLNIRGKATASAREQVLHKVGLTGLEKQPARRLSGGEQQRLALARTLALKPDILFLDEPTASLDPASVIMIEQIVRELHLTGTKIVFVTHDIGQAKRLGDEVVFIHRGRITEQTPAQSFFDSPVSQPAKDYLAGRIVL